MLAPKSLRFPRKMANLDNEALLEGVVAELQRRMASHSFKRPLAPIPFLNDKHYATPEYEKELRCCLGITQTNMAKLLEIGSDVLSRYERHKDGLAAAARARLEALGSQFAHDGVRPEIPEEFFSGGGTRSKPQAPVRTVDLATSIPTGSVLRPRFAVREFIWGILAALAAVGIFVVLS